MSQDEFNNANLRLIINTVSPFSFIEHPEFIRYTELTSNKTPVSRRTLVHSIETMYDSMIKELIEELSSISYVCLTADCWSVFRR